MIIEAVRNLDSDDVVEKESKDVLEARDEVFRQVKKLFQITSNKKSIWSNYDKKIKAIDIRLDKLNKVEKKVEVVKEKITQDIENLRDKYDQTKSLLQKSLEGGKS